MESSDLIDLIRDYSVALLDAPNGDERAQLCDEIAADPDLAAGILMLLSEQINPLLPPPAAPTYPAEMIQ